MTNSRNDPNLGIASLVIGPSVLPYFDGNGNRKGDSSSVRSQRRGRPGLAPGFPVRRRTESPAATNTHSGEEPSSRSGSCQTAGWPL